MKFEKYLKESMITNAESYTTNMVEIDDYIIFDIYTNEARNYRMIFVLKETKNNFVNLECKIGYESVNKKSVVQIKSDFYDTKMLINTLNQVFTMLHADLYGKKFKVKHTFQGNIDLAYKMMLVSMFQHELKYLYDYKSIDDDSTSFTVYSKG